MIQLLEVILECGKTGKSEAEILLGWVVCISRAICLRGKGPPRSKRAPMKLTSSGYPMERIATDILGPFPETDKKNRYILVISDFFTKWVEAFPIPDQRAETVAKCLVDEVIRRFGVPGYIHSDQG